MFRTLDFITNQKFTFSKYSIKISLRMAHKPVPLHDKYEKNEPEFETLHYGRG